MSYYIIISGPLAYGKFTVSKKLQKKLKAKYLRVDRALKEADLDKESKEEGYLLWKFLLEIFN